jgi:hypothetical protein
MPHSIAWSPFLVSVETRLRGLLNDQKSPNICHQCLLLDWTERYLGIPFTRAEYFFFFSKSLIVETEGIDRWQRSQQGRATRGCQKRKKLG